MSTNEFRIATIYRTKAGEDRCLVFGGRGDMLAGREGSTAAALAEADPEFDDGERFYSLCLDRGVSFRDMDPSSSTAPGRSMPRAYVEYPWAMKPQPLEGDREWGGWPWVMGDIAEVESR